MYLCYDELRNIGSVDGLVPKWTPNALYWISSNKSQRIFDRIVIIFVHESPFHNVTLFDGGHFVHVETILRQ